MQADDYNSIAHVSQLNRSIAPRDLLKNLIMHNYINDYS